MELHWGQDGLRGGGLESIAGSLVVVVGNILHLALAPGQHSQ